MNTTSNILVKYSLEATGSPHGHTGPVRFLSSVEVPKAQFKTVENDEKESRTTPSPSNSLKKSKDKSSKSKTTERDNSGSLTLVISGGDGYEDFRTNTQTEAVGRDDSTNHVLIWRV